MNRCALVLGAFGFLAGCPELSETDAGGGSEGNNGVEDSGSEATDAGGAVEDAGNAFVDAGSPATDAGGPILDAGSIAVDAGSPMDAGTHIDVSFCMVNHAFGEHKSLFVAAGDLDGDDQQELVFSNVVDQPNRVWRFDELGRYLDYCSEMLSILSKIAAIWAQAFPEPVVLTAGD